MMNETMPCAEQQWSKVKSGKFQRVNNARPVADAWCVCGRTLIPPMFRQKNRARVLTGHGNVYTDVFRVMGPSCRCGARLIMTIAPRFSSAYRGAPQGFPEHRSFTKPLRARALPLGRKEYR